MGDPYSQLRDQMSEMAKELAEQDEALAVAQALADAALTELFGPCDFCLDGHYLTGHHDEECPWQVYRRWRESHA